MLAVEVVVVEPGVELLFPFERGLIGSGVGPFAQRGLDEAFRFSVGARGVGPGEAVFDASLEQQGLEAAVAVTGPLSVSTRLTPKPKRE